MNSLVQIPWQPHLYLTPDTLALLNAASKKRGHPLYLVGDDAAWRSWASQDYYYQRSLHGEGPVASPPDSGPRMHMRGGAFDLRDTDAATQRACRAVGLIRDSDEPWHWNNPRGTAMPIIRMMPVGGIVIDPHLEEEEDMKPKVSHRTERGDEWTLAHPNLPNGHLVTVDPATGLAWERLYARGRGTADQLNRADYIAMQIAAKAVAAAWVA